MGGGRPRRTGRPRLRERGRGEPQRLVLVLDDGCDAWAWLDQQSSGNRGTVGAERARTGTPGARAPREQPGLRSGRQTRWLHQGRHRAGEVPRRRQADRRGHLRPVAIGSVTALRRCPDERGVARALLEVWSSRALAVLIVSWRSYRQLASSSSAGAGRPYLPPPPTEG